MPSRTKQIDPGALLLSAVAQLKIANENINTVVSMWPEDTSFEPRAFKPELVGLIGALRTATAAVQTLERMASGVKPPKLGD